MISSVFGFRRHLSPVCTLPRRLQHARRGSVALLFALLFIPVIGAIGIAIDYAAATQAQSELSLALDSATMQAVNSAANDFASDPANWLAPAQAAGVQRFTAQAGSVANVAVQPASISITHQGAQFTATGSYTASYTTFLGSLFGVANIGISDTAAVTITAGPYVDLQVIMDDSSSMTIAASPADIDSMLAVTQPVTKFAYPASAGWWAGGCAFACHWDPGNNDFYGASRQNGITLRLDELKGAVATIAASVQASGRTDLYRLGLYTFADSLTQNIALTNNTTSVANAANGVTAPLWPGTEEGHDTMITESLYTMAQNHMAQAGNGSTASSPKKYVFLMTDGIEDVPDCCGGRIELAVDPAACEAMKATGATVIVLHTEYYNPNGIFSEISAIQDQVTANLQACASDPTLYYDVSDQSQINEAVQAMLNTAMAIPATFVQ